MLSARECTSTAEPYGKVVENNDRLVVSCGDNTALEILTVQPEGKNVMSASDMIRGSRIQIGTVVD